MYLDVIMSIDLLIGNPQSLLQIYKINSKMGSHIDKNLTYNLSFLYTDVDIIFYSVFFFNRYLFYFLSFVI